MIIHVGDADDPRLDDYRALKEADLIGRQGVFVAEGTKVVALWASNPSAYRFRSVFLGENRLDEMRPVLPPETPIYVAPPEVMNRVVGFHIHRGCLAAGTRGVLPAAFDVLQAPGPAMVLVGIGISNHDNVGALYRNAAAFGARTVLLDDRSADPLYRKAIRVSMGHVLTMPAAERVPAHELIAAIKRAGFAVWAATPRSSARDLGALVRAPGSVPPRIAIVVGSEGEGLDDEILSAANLEVRIPMADGVDSLNVATAAAVVAFAVEAMR